MSLLDGDYGTLVWLGECESGHPIVTFTLDPQKIGTSLKPSVAYLQKLAAGIILRMRLFSNETHLCFQDCAMRTS